MLSVDLKNHFPHVELTKKSVTFYTAALLSEKAEYKSELIPSSSGNVIYKLQNESKSYIFKLFIAQELLPVRRLVQVYDYLTTKTDMLSPKVIKHDRSRTFFSGAVLLQDYQQGVELIDCFQKHISETSELLDQVHTIVEKVHAIPVDDVKDFWFPNDWEEQTHPPWYEYIRHEIISTMEKIFQFQLSEEQMRKIIIQLRDLLSYIERKDYSVVPLHGDLSPHNFVIGHETNCQVIRILDFERARLGDKLWDFAYFYGWLQRVDEILATLWQNTFWEKLNSTQQQAFNLFVVLFHAWTVRDMLTYEGDLVRKQRALTSLKILKKVNI